MSQRDWLGSLLLHSGRFKDALSFAQQWIVPEIHDKCITPPAGGVIFTEPSPDLLPPAYETRLLSGYRESIHASAFYTAAFAAFKIWGECPLAAQYLRIAVKANPTILTRVLARHSIPGKFIDSPLREVRIHNLPIS